MDLSVVIVNYQTFELTKNTINSILKYTYPFSYEIIVVDNASSDDSLSKLQEYFEDNVTFIASKENNGFAAGNNQALEIAAGKYVLLLNSDTIVWENTLENIYNYMEKHTDVGAAGCRVLLENGELDKACKRSFPNVKNSFFRLFHIPTNSSDDNYNLDNLPDGEIYEIGCLTGAFMFIRKDALDEIGFLDETFFMYGEDIDLCYRIKQANWKIIYYGESRITHLKGASSKKQKSKLIYEFYRAMYIYYKKHHASDSSFITNIVVYIGIALLCILKLFLNLFKKKSVVSFIRYPFSIMAIVDLISILPSVFVWRNGLQTLRMFRIIRALKVFRVFKTLRYSKSMQMLRHVISKTKNSLITVCFLSIGYVLISALIIFNVEPATFDTFFDAVYWATVSLTTIGYGDIYPVSTLGRLITMISSFLGIAVVALPAGIITAGYMNELQNNKEDEI